MSAPAMAQVSQTQTAGLPTSGSTTNWAPTAKVSAGVLAASVTTLIFSVLKNHWNFDISAADGAALTTLVTFAIQYMVPERRI